MKYRKTLYVNSETGTTYDFLTGKCNLKENLESPSERFNAIGLILRDYADTLHTSTNRDVNDRETDIRALACWCDELCHQESISNK